LNEHSAYADDDQCDATEEGDHCAPPAVTATISAFISTGKDAANAFASSAVLKLLKVILAQPPEYLQGCASSSPASLTTRT
jgi:hypothetical protein